MSIETILSATTQLAQAAEDFRRQSQSVAADPGLSRQGRMDARDRLRRELTEVVERVTGEATPLLRAMETQNEDRLRELSRGPDANDAVARIGMALEQSHPGDLIDILVEDDDTAGLLALRQIAPSIAGRFTKVPEDRAKLSETIRHGVDKALASPSPRTPAETAAAERFAIDDAREHYLSAVNYAAVQPNAHGQLGYAFGEAMASA